MGWKGRCTDFPGLATALIMGAKIVSSEWKLLNIPSVDIKQAASVYIGVLFPGMAWGESVTTNSSIRAVRVPFNLHTQGISLHTP